MRPRTRLLLYAATASTDTWLAGRAEPWARRLRHATKPALMPLLAGRLREAPRTELTAPTTVALAAGWGGDVALLGEGRRSFLAGLGCFAVGHAAYVAGLRRRAAPGPWTDARGPRVAALGGAVVGPALAAAAGRRDPALVAPVAAYAGLLAATAACATHLDAGVPLDARRMLGAGAWLFLVSDTVLGARSFVMTQRHPWADRTVMATYALAQALLVEGAVRA